MSLYKIELNKEQLVLLSKALEFYARIGILQFDKILEHPTIKNINQEKYRHKGEVTLNSETERGRVVEIGDGYIDTEGSWGNGIEVKRWYDLENVKLSIDRNRYHDRVSSLEGILSTFKHLLTDGEMGIHTTLSISSNRVDKTSTLAYDIQQQINNLLWKESDDSVWSVDSFVVLSDGNNKIKIEKVDGK